MSQLDPIRSSFDGICQKLWHHENVAADLFHICQRRWYRTGTIEKPALQRYAGEMVLQSSGPYEYSWLGQKSMGETYGTHHRLGHRPLHGCSPGHDPGASATAVRQRCSDADGSGWASPQSMVPSRSPRFFPAPFEAIWDTLHFWTNICRYIIIYILHIITLYYCILNI